MQGASSLASGEGSWKIVGPRSLAQHVGKINFYPLRNAQGNTKIYFILHLVDLRINETLQTGAVRKPHLPGGASVYLFLEFTIVDYYIALAILFIVN